MSKITTDLSEKKSINIFISYNPNEEIEQGTALRLQTLAFLYGVDIFLPNRINFRGLNPGTKERILTADWVIVFSTKSLSKDVKEELEFALENNKKIVVIYGKQILKTLKIKGVIEYILDDDEKKPDKIISEVMGMIGKKQKSKEENKAFWVIFGIGLGMFILWMLNKHDKKERRNNR